MFAAICGSAAARECLQPDIWLAGFAIRMFAAARPLGVHGTNNELLFSELCLWVLIAS
jgi:hypothetical protein